VSEDPGNRAATLAALTRMAEAAAREHPTPEQLFAYQEGQLTADEEDAIREHLALCPDCTRMVLELAGVVQGELPEAAPLSEREAASLATAIARFAAPRGKERRTYHGALRRLALPLAASLATVALASLFWARSRPLDGGAAAGARANVAVRELVPVAQGISPSDRGQPEPLPPATPAVVLVLDVADQRGFPRYLAVVSDQRGGRVLMTNDALQRSPLGNFTLEIVSPLPGSGLYHIQLWGLDGGRRVSLAEYQVDLRTAG
jgi:hypothetical protein